MTRPETDLPRLLTRHREGVLAAVSRHRGRRVRLLGSFGPDRETTHSEFDLVVDFEEGSSLFDLMHLERDIETLVGRPVRVVSAGGLKQRDLDVVGEAVDL